ncbi:hypothetical protein [Trinickia terrae]|uniref:hypothetical protein n=1 Tax=Trinickia terrae TaxID=2571161 RepID=UPI00146D6103|nr:hypothetical protein [Trinickia terrae]
MSTLPSPLALSINLVERISVTRLEPDRIGCSWSSAPLGQTFLAMSSAGLAAAGRIGNDASIAPIRCDPRGNAVLSGLRQIGGELKAGACVLRATIGLSDGARKCR